MLRTLIIEDEPHSRNELQFLLSRQPEFVWIGSCGSISTAKTLLNSTQPDVVLLDIELEDGNAFDLLQSLPVIPFKIIFVTAYNEHALRAIKFSALDYLIELQTDGLSSGVYNVALKTGTHHITRKLSIVK